MNTRSAPAPSASPSPAATAAPRRRPATRPRKVRAAVASAVLAWVAAVAPTQAAPVISPEGTPWAASSIANSLVASHWYFDRTFTHLRIAAALGTTLVDGGGSTATAWLMRTAGPGATEADEIARATVHIDPFSPMSPFDNMVELFSGLTLGPGSYWLMFAGTGYGDHVGGGLNSFEPITYALAPGVTMRGTYWAHPDDLAPYRPASSLTRSIGFNPYFSVTSADGPGHTVPLPSTLWLTAAALPLLAWRRRARSGAAAG